MASLTAGRDHPGNDGMNPVLPNTEENLPKAIELMRGKDWLQSGILDSGPSGNRRIVELIVSSIRDATTAKVVCEDIDHKDPDELLRATVGGVHDVAREFRQFAKEEVQAGIAADERNLLIGGPPFQIPLPSPPRELTPYIYTAATAQARTLEDLAKVRNMNRYGQALQHERNALDQAFQAVEYRHGLARMMNAPGKPVQQPALVDMVRDRNMQNTQNMQYPQYMQNTQNMQSMTGPMNQMFQNDYSSFQYPQNAGQNYPSHPDHPMMQPARLTPQNLNMSQASMGYAAAPTYRPHQFQQMPPPQSFMMSPQEGSEVSFASDKATLSQSFEPGYMQTRPSGEILTGSSSRRSYATTPANLVSERVKFHDGPSSQSSGGTLRSGRTGSPKLAPIGTGRKNRRPRRGTKLAGNTGTMGPPTTAPFRPRLPQNPGIAEGKGTPVTPENQPPKKLGGDQDSQSTQPEPPWPGFRYKTADSHGTWGTRLTEEEMEEFGITPPAHEVVRRRNYITPRRN